MKKLAVLVSTTIAIILMALPYGAIMVWASSPNGRIIETFSYFSIESMYNSTSHSLSSIPCRL